MRFSKRSLEGELFIDHSASPGIPDEIAIWGGLDPKLASKGQLVEMPIVTCAHCQTAVLLNPDRTRERGWCQKCDKYLCDECQARMHLTLRCDSIQRKLETVVNDLERFGSSALLLHP